DKATMEVPSPFAGSITGLRAEPGQSIKVGDIALTYSPTGQREDDGSRVEERDPGEDRGMKEDGREAASQAPRFSISSAGSRGLASPVRAAPSVRYMARKMGLDLGQIRGSGPGGRILIDDLSAHLAHAGVKQLSTELPPNYGTPGTRIKLQG